MRDARVLWAYGVVRGYPTPQSEPPGLDGRPVECVRHGDLAVLVSALPSDRFSGDGLRQRLEQLDTLAEMARAHDAVLEAALAGGPVVPFRMCTLYQTTAAIRHMLKTEADRLERVLARVRDKAEWGVKAFLQPRREPAMAGRPGSGTEYLARRRTEHARAEAADDAVTAAVAEIHAALSASAAAAVVGRSQDRALTGRDAEMVLNASYLVDRDAAEEFAALVETLARRRADDGLELELTGPWPPYHFAEEPPS